MTVTEFASNMTQLGQAVVSLVGQAGTDIFMKEPYIYLITFGIVFGVIALAGSYLLRRRAARRARR